MEEAEVPLENLQEHIHHSAGHSGEAWVLLGCVKHGDSRSSGAIASLLSGKHRQRTM